MTGGILSDPQFREDQIREDPIRMKDEDSLGSGPRVGGVGDFSNQKDTRGLSTGR